MGGFGSGRWGWHTKATTVEECRNIDAALWTREGVLRPDASSYGSSHWTNAAGEDRGSIRYEADTTVENPYVRLTYRVTPPGEDLDYKVGLQTTRPRLGGVRWWFTCPLVVNGRPCLRRIGKLYLPPRGRYFGCRHCHGLTYRSAQEHDKRVDLLRRNPEALEALIEGADEGNPGALILALKALR